MPEAYRPEHAAQYGLDNFSLGLRQAAQLIKARVGLEAVSLDLEGWDSHFTQSTIMDPLMTRLGQGLAAVIKQYYPKWLLLASVTLLIFANIFN